MKKNKIRKQWKETRTRAKWAKRFNRKRRAALKQRTPLKANNKYLIRGAHKKAKKKREKNRRKEIRRKEDEEEAPVYNVKNNGERSEGGDAPDRNPPGTLPPARTLYFRNKGLRPFPSPPGALGSPRGRWANAKPKQTRGGISRDEI